MWGTSLSWRGDGARSERVRLDGRKQSVYRPAISAANAESRHLGREAPAVIRSGPTDARYGSRWAHGHWLVVGSLCHQGQWSVVKGHWLLANGLWSSANVTVTVLGNCIA